MSHGFGHSNFHGSQEKFDRNGDGHLNGREWTSWYYNTYGADIEMEERRQVQQAKTQWSLWLAQALPVIELAYSQVTENARTLIQNRAAETQAGKAFLYWITYGFVSGSAWEKCCTTDVGEFVGNSSFYPYQELLRNFLKNHPELGSYTEVQNAVQNNHPLYEEIGILTEHRCGTFWNSIIRSLPPHHKDALPPFNGSGVYTTYGNTEKDAAVRCLREIMQAIFPIYTFFSGVVNPDEESDKANEHRQAIVEMHWKKRRKPEVSSKIDTPDSGEDDDTAPDEDDVEEDQDEPEEPEPVRNIQTSAQEKKEHRLWPVFIVIIAVLAAVGVVFGLFLPHAWERAAVYQEALSYLSNEDYDLAWQKFRALGDYRDADKLETYCKYAELYTDMPDLYRGGEAELHTIRLFYDTEYQRDVDALETHIIVLKVQMDLEKQHAEEQRKERAKQKQEEELEKIHRDLEEKLRQIEEEHGVDSSAASGSMVQTPSSGTVYDGYHGQTFNYGGGSSGDDPMNAKDYYSWEDFYEDHWMDFGGPDDAEMYYDDHR